MRARRDRSRPTNLRLTQLEDRSVPAVLDVTLPPPPPFDPHAHVGLNFQPPTTMLGGTHYLTGPQEGDALTLARLALANNAPGMNLSFADVVGAQVTDFYRSSTGSQLAHAFFRQSHNGLEVLNTTIGVHVTPDGKILSINGGFVSGLSAAATGVIPTPAVGAADAVAAAAAYFGVTLTSAPVLTSTSGSIDSLSLVSEPEVGAEPIDARLVYVNTAGGVRLAWHFDIDVPAPDQWFDVAVDAQTGQVTFYANWVQAYSATYNVQPLPTNDPQTGPRVITVNPADPVASPFGWQDIDGDAAPEFTDTRGNNVFAQFDPFDTNSSFPFTASSNRPDAGAGLVFNYPLNLAAAPNASIDAAVTNLFYLNNVIHDIHFKYGFDEAAGNFQEFNYTPDGLGGDAVEADVQDSSAFGQTNNAYFATPPDGQRGNMAMFVFDITNPFRDSSFSTEIVVHEYGHGVSTRLTGGPANANGLNNLQSAGMGEGWSDWWGSMFTQKPGDTAGGGYVQAAWVNGNPASGPGDRRFPYSFDKLVDPLTFEVFGNSGSVVYPTASGPQTVFRSTEVHDAGEIWASALWDMNWLLIDKYGFDKDLSTGYAPGNGPSSAGNKLALQLVIDGLKMQPVNPSFTEARDAILAADFDLTGGQNQREIWTAFARRGLGFAAFTNNSGDTSVSTDFNVPPSLSRPGIIGVTPAARTIGGAAPTGVTFKFSEPMNTTSFDTISDVISFTGPGALDIRASITGFTWNPNPAASNDNTELRINFTPPSGTAAQGNYSLRLAPGIVSADNQASPLDQNIDGNAGTVADQFVANFRYDLKALTALLTSSPSPADPSLPGSIIAVFNEAIDPLSVSVADLQVSEGTVVLATPIRSDPNDINSPVLTVRYDLTGVTAAPLFVTIKYGSITDLFGFPVEEANAQFGRLVIPATPFPTPLASYGPLGWEAFGGQVTGNLIDFGQIDSYSIELDAGQSLSVVADQLTSLRAQVRLFDPSGNPIALATGAQQGDPVSVGPVVAPAPGRYVMQITGPSSSVGPYRLRALLGAVVENETSNPSVTNDVQFSAESLTGLFATQGGPGSTLRSVTIAGNVGTVRPGSGPGPFGTPNDTSDYYSFPVTAGQRTSVGMNRAAGGSTLTLTVRDGSGAVVPLDLPNPGNFDRSATFTPAANGTYTVQVSNLTTSARGTDYALTVVLNGVLDREPNNTPLTAQALQSLNTNVRGGLSATSPDTNQDWYSFTLTAVTDVYLTSLTPGDGPNQPDNFLNPMIELFDNAGSLMVPLGAPLFANDNGAGDGKNALIVADDLPAGTYRFRVRPSTATPFTTSGEYIVKLDTTPNPGPINPSTGGPYTIAEGQDLVLNGTATDPNGDPLTYTWDLNGDGTFGDATGRAPTVPWAQLRALGINDGPATFSIQVRVDDGTNPPVTSVPSSLILDNAAPLGLLYIDSTGTDTARTVDEGASGVVVRLVAPPLPGFAEEPPYDPASNPRVVGQPPTSLDDSIGLRYSFDLDGNTFYDDGAGDGTYAGSLSTPQVTVPSTSFADGPGTLVVRGMVIDKDNGSTVSAVTFTIRNLAPKVDSATLTGTLVNGTGQLTEGTDGRITLSGASDAAADVSAGLRYAFDLDNDGQFDDGAGDGTYAGSLLIPTAVVPMALLPDGPGTVTFRVKVIDKDDGTLDPITGLPVVGSVTTSYPLSYVNAPPTGTPVVLINNVVTANPVVNEGTGVTVRVDAATDPSTPDQTAGFTYQYDFNYTGTFSADLTTTVNSAAVPVPNNLDNGDATLTVAVRVYDRDGGFSEQLVQVGVLNVAPTASVVADPVTIGTPTSITLSNPNDPSSVDQTAGFLYSFDFNGDGDFTDPGDVLNSPSSSASFTFATPGTKPVITRISDKVFGTNVADDSTTYPTTVQVLNVQPTATLFVQPTVVEGGALSIRVAGEHRSAAVVAAGFTFDIDFDGDGVFDQSVPRNPAAPVQFVDVAIPAQYLVDGPRPLSVRARVTESIDGLSGEAVAPLQVLNAPPTAQFDGPIGEVRVSDRVTFTLSSATDLSPVDRASLRYSIDLNNDGDFTDEGEFADSSTPTVTTQFRTGGTKVVRGRVADKDGGFTDYFVPVTVIGQSKGGFAVGADAGNAPLVQLYDATGNVKFRTNAFDATMTGGVRVAVADVNGDGIADIVAGTGPGVPAEIRVIDGKTGNVMFSSRPFEGFTGGTFVAAGDMDGDGRAEFVVSPDEGGGARVIVYRGLGLIQTLSFLGIDDDKFRGGARVGLADINGDGRADLLVSAGFMGGPRVAGYEGSGLLTGTKAKLFNDFFAFEDTLRNGVYLTGGDVNGDGFADLIVGAGPGGAPRVTVFDGRTLLSSKVTQVASFFTGNDESRGGVRVTVADVDKDGLADVVTGEADGPRVNIFLGKNVRTGLPGDDVELTPFSTPMNGVFVG